MANQISYKGILVINGKQVEETFNGLKRASAQLDRELKKLPQGSQEFIDKSKELEIVNQRFQRVKAEIDATKKTLKAAEPELKSFGDIGSYIAEKFSSGVTSSNLSLKSIGSGIKLLASEAWTAISSIPIAGWITAGVGALAVGIKQVLDFNTELYEANKLTSDITKLQGDQLDKMTVRSQTMEELFKFDKKETLVAARNLVENFKISYEEAMDVIEDGAIRGGKSNDEFLDSIKEYPVFFAKAGYSAKDFVNIINAGFDLGIYSDKLPDALKEFDLSMREQTKSTRDALVNAFGASFSDDLLKKVSTGKTTVKDALVEISKESEKYNLTQKQQAQLTADIFRGAGEDVGGFQKIMDAVTVSIVNQGGELTAEQQILKNQMDAYNELGDAKVDALKSDELLALKQEFDIFWTKLKTGFFNFISWIKLADREFQASAIYMRGVFMALPNTASTAFKSIINALGDMISGFSSGGKSIALFLKGDFEGAETEAKKFLNTLPNVYAKIKSTQQQFASDLNKSGLAAANDFRKKYDATTKANALLYRTNNPENGKPENGLDGSEAKNAAAKKAAEKAAKAAEAAAKKAEADRKKALEDQKKDLEESLKAEAEANNQSLAAEIQFQIDKANLLNESREKEIKLEDLNFLKELDNQRKQKEEILKTISDLEKKRDEAKSPEAKSNYETALANQRKLLELHNQTVEITTDTHRKKVATINENWDSKDFQKAFDAEQKLIENQRRSDEDEITNIDDLSKAKALLKDNEYLKLTDQELSGIQTLEDAKAALREAADRKMLQAQLVSLEVSRKQLVDNIASMADGPEKEALLKNLDELAAKITGVKSAIKNGQEQDAAKKVQEETEQKGTVDILGFSAAQWEKTWNDLETTAGKIELAKMAVQALSNAFASFSQLQQALNAKEMSRFEKNQNKKKESLKKQLLDGWISQEEYNKNLQLLEAQTANKKAEMEYKAAKAQKTQQLAAAVSGTALGVIGALTMQPWTWANIAAAAIVGTMGAVNIATIAAQPLPDKPSYAGGGFTGDGFGTPDDTGYKPAGIVHENEWVAPEWMLEEPRTAKVIDYLESVRVGRTKPMAEGGFSNDASSGNSASSSNATSLNDSQLVAVLAELKVVLTEIKDEGIVAYILKTAKNGKELKEMIDDYTTLKNKNKHG